MREAHPIDGNAPSTFGLVEDPVDDRERLQVAGTCVEELDLPMPALIDRVDDKVSLAYAAWPDRLYLIGKDGRVVYAGDRGPQGFDPEAWMKAIEAAKARIDAGSPADKPPAGKPRPEPTAPQKQDR